MAQTFRETVQVIRLLRPKTAVVENVMGLKHVEQDSSRSPLDIFKAGLLASESSLTNKHSVSLLG